VDIVTSAFTETDGLRKLSDFSRKDLILCTYVKAFHHFLLNSTNNSLLKLRISLGQCSSGSTGN
jgi:hypothetical protein